MAEDIKRKKKTNKKSGKKFWKGFGIYVAIMAVLVIVLYIYVWNTMKKYEKAQPENIMETLVSQLEKGDMQSVSKISGGKFEPDLDLTKDFSDSVKGGKITYKVKKTGTDSMEYYIMNGDKKAATAVISSSNNRKILGILAISDWNIESVTPVNPDGATNVKITIPEKYTAKINGVELSQTEQEGDLKAIDGAEHVAEYIGDNVPKVRTYKVKGLVNTPVITVTDENGNDVDMSGITNYSDIVVPYGYQNMPQELMDYAYEAATAYSNFFSRDLAGCSQSTDCLQKYFVKNSYYIDLAEQYRVGDMWMYSRHNTPVFINTGVTEYVPYNDQCFSCRVFFDKSMYLTATGETRVETTDQTYYFVNTDGQWLIADIKTNN